MNFFRDDYSSKFLSLQVKISSFNKNAIFTGAAFNFYEITLLAFMLFLGARLPIYFFKILILRRCSGKYKHEIAQAIKVDL